MIPERGAEGEDLLQAELLLGLAAALFNDRGAQAAARPALEPEIKEEGGEADQHDHGGEPQGVAQAPARGHRRLDVERQEGPQAHDGQVQSVGERQLLALEPAGQHLVVDHQDGLGADAVDGAAEEHDLQLRAPFGEEGRAQPVVHRAQELRQALHGAQGGQGRAQEAQEAVEDARLFQAELVDQNAGDQQHQQKDVGHGIGGKKQAVLRAGEAEAAQRRRRLDQGAQGRDGIVDEVLGEADEAHDGQHQPAKIGLQRGTVDGRVHRGSFFCGSGKSPAVSGAATRHRGLARAVALPGRRDRTRGSRPRSPCGRRGSWSARRSGSS